MKPATHKNSQQLTCKSLLFIVIFCGSFQTLKSQCDLPQELPPTLEELEDANRIIAECYAPTIHQLAQNRWARSFNGKADLIVSPFYDGDINTGNNWENLDLISNLNDSSLHPAVFYSVVWTEFYWVVTYAFYHARDYSRTGVLINNNCCSDNHENDLEAAIFFVQRNDSRLFHATSLFHFLAIDYYGLFNTPTVFIDNETHGVKLNLDLDDCLKDGPLGGNPCENCLDFNTPHVIYTPSESGASSLNIDISPETNSNSLTGTGQYILEDIFGSHQNSLGNLRNSNPNVFNGNTWHQNGNDDCMGAGSTAKAPWGFESFSYTAESLMDRLNGIVTRMEHNPYFDGRCSDPLDILIDRNTTWEESPLSVIKSIVVSGDAHLRINDQNLLFTKGGAIALFSNSRLTINNSILTSASCSPEDNWLGIQSIDGNGSERWITIKESTIENSGNGLHLNLSHGNSRHNIFLDNSSFINNGFGFDVFGAHQDNTNNLIEVYGTIFENNRRAIRIENASDIQVYHSNFIGNDVGIEAKNSFVNVHSGEFENNNRGIIVEGTFPLSAGLIVGDIEQDAVQFKDNQIAIIRI